MVGPQPTALDAARASALANSPRQAMVGSAGGGGGGSGGGQALNGAVGRRTPCSRSNNLLTVLALAMVAGCTTIALQLVASERNGPTHASELKAETPDLVPPQLELRPEGGPPPGAAGGATDTNEHHAYSYVDSVLAAIAPSRFRRRPLVDRRFAGQRTGRAPMPEEEVR